MKPFWNHFDECTLMPAITVKNIPDDLYRRLKAVAEMHHRSINSELIVCLEQVLSPVRMTVDEHLVAAARIRAQLDGVRVTEKEISAAKRAGRP
jgi:plasmid stability protein